MVRRLLVGSRTNRYLKIAQGPGTFGRDAFGQHAIQRVVNGIGDHVADNMPQRDGCRVRRVNNRVFRRGNHKRRQRRGVVWNLRRYGTFKGVARVGLGVDQGYVDAFWVQTGGAGEVAMYRIFPDLKTDFEFDRRMKPVDRHRPACRPARQLGNAFYRCPSRVFKNKLCNPVQIDQAKLGHHVHETPMTDLVTGSERMNVTHQLIRLTHVCTHQI